jgi:hypothetical protein
MKLGHTNSRLLRTAVSCIGGGLVIGFVCLLIVPWLGWMWHLVSGDRATVGGVSVSVPSRYFAMTNPNGSVSQWRCGFGFPLSHAHWGFVGVYRVARVPRLRIDTDFERIRSIVIAERESNGMMFRSQEVLHTAAGPAACFQFRGNDGASVVCLLLGDHQLSLRYEGDEAFTPDAYEIVKSARPASRQQP